MKVTSKIVEARKGGNGRKWVTMAPWHHPQTPKTHQQTLLQNKTRKNKITYIYIYDHECFFLLFFGIFLLPCF
jgi:hypothetical protein